MGNHNIRAFLEVNPFLSVNGYNIYIFESISLSFSFSLSLSLSLSLFSITDIRQIETMFTEITLKLSPSPQKKHPHHISKPKKHLGEVICNLFEHDETGSHCYDLPKLQLILLPTRECGYLHVITQILVTNFSKVQNAFLFHMFTR